MPDSAQCEADGASRKGKRKRGNIPARGHNTTDAEAALPLQPEGALLHAGQLRNRARCFSAHARLVGCKAAICSVTRGAPVGARRL